MQARYPPSSDVQEKLRHEVSWISPVPLSGPFRQLDGLIHPWGRELAMKRGLDRRAIESVIVNVIHLLLNPCGFARILPNRIPILFARCRSPSSDDFKHEFGGILV